MNGPEEKVSAHVDALIEGRAPRGFDAEPETVAAAAAANRLAAALWPDPDPAFVARLHDRLQHDLDRRRQTRITRRSLLVAAGALAAGAAGFVGGRTLVTPPPASSTLIAHGAAWRFAARLDELPERAAVAFATDNVQLLLVRTGQDVRALIGTCTHLGCRLAPAGAAIACPCHRTRFALDGRVVEHELPQAPAALPQVPARVVDGRVEVLTV